MFHVLQFILIFSVTSTLHFSPIDVKRSREYETIDGISKKLNVSTLTGELPGEWQVNYFRTIVFDSSKNHANSASLPFLSKEDYSIEDTLKTKRFCAGNKGVKACLEVEFKRKPKKQIGKRLRNRRDADSDFPISDDVPSDEEYKDDVPDNDFGDGQTKNRTGSAKKHVVVKVPVILSGSENFYDIAKNSSGTKRKMKNVPKLGDGENNGSDFGGGNLDHPEEYDGELSIDDNSGSKLGDDEYDESDSGSKKGNLDHPEEYDGEFSVDDNNSGPKLEDEDYDGSDSGMKKKNLDRFEEYDGKLLTDSSKLGDKKRIASDSGGKKKKLDHTKKHDGELRNVEKSGPKLGDEERIGSDSGRNEKNLDHPEEYDGELRVDDNSGLKLGDKERERSASGSKKKNLDHPEKYDGKLRTDSNLRLKQEDKERDESASGKKKKNFDKLEEYDSELRTDDNSRLKLKDKEHDENASGGKKKNPDHHEEYDGGLPTDDISDPKLEDEEHDESDSAMKKKNLDQPEEYDGGLPTDISDPKLEDEEHDESDSGMKKKNLDQPEEYDGELPTDDNSGNDDDGDEYADANGEDDIGKQKKPHIQTRSHSLQDDDEEPDDNEKYDGDEKHDAKLDNDEKQEIDFEDGQGESYLSVKSLRGGKRIEKVGAKSASLNDDDDTSDYDENEGYSSGGNKYGTKHGGSPGRRIGSIGNGLKGHYYPKGSEAAAPYDWNRCKVPARKSTYESLCKVMPGGVKCNLYCIFGHTFPEGIQRKTSCSHQTGRWTRPFVDCIPFADCTLQMTSAGTLKCKTNTLQEGSRCTVSCERYGANAPSRQRTYACTSRGSWKPRLPHCVKPQGINIVPPPRFRVHKEIRYP